MPDTKQPAPEAEPWVDPTASVELDATHWAFFFDIDGTLLDYAETPDAVRVGPALPGLLADLMATTGGAVALVSGRRLADIERLFPGLDVAAAGQHGAEFRGLAGGAPDATIADAEFMQLRDAARQAGSAHPRLLVEDKGRSIAIHYRQAPALAPIARWLALRLAGRSAGRFVVQRGHYVEEVKAAGASKGGAIDRLLGEPAFRGRRPVFVGDDVGDEDGFRRVNALGGVSIKVGAGPTAARGRLRDPAAVIAWLDGVVAHFRQHAGDKGDEP